MSGPAGDDAVDLLTAQHARIKDLFTRAAVEDQLERVAPFSELAHLLAVHETAEEEVVHPLARRTPDDAGDRLVERRLAEEREAKELLRGMIRAGVDDPEYGANLLRLRTMVTEHARHEEEEEFPLLRRLHGDRIRGLAPVVRAAESVAPPRPHPGVETGMENLLAGPFLAVADRVRDAMRRAEA